MGSEAQRGFVTENEFFSLPESNQLVELLDGEVYMPPAPSPLHQQVVGRLYREVSAWADAHPPAFVGLAPLDVRLAPNRVVQPDVFVLLGGLLAPEGPIEQVPELVVEVLSQNRSHDRITKRLVYAQAGVVEYWIVDPMERSIEICSGLNTVEVASTRAESRVLPDLALDLAALFR
jgi:Uma2 family endonuclease